MNQSAGVSGAEDLASRGRVEFFSDLQMVADGPHRCGHCQAELHGVKPLVASKESEARVAALREALAREVDPYGAPGLVDANVELFAELVDLLDDESIEHATIPAFMGVDAERVMAVLRKRCEERGVRLFMREVGERTIVVTLAEDPDGGGA